ncbi:MAG: hypothetical protein FWH01_08080 [Oscillospiraceae bacterium]|nr:hypothetical protein [Oscillospiraceae bacterium]
MDTANKIFSSPVYVIDAFYNLIAFSGVPADESFWSVLLKTGTFDEYAKELMASENVVRDVSYSHKIVRLKCDEWKHNLITGHIYNGDNIWVGEMTMYENISFDAERMAAFEFLLDKISNEIRNYEYFTKQPAIFFENTIIKLLDKTVRSTPVNNPQAQIMYYGLESYLSIAVVDAVRDSVMESVRKSRLAYFQSLLKNKFQYFPYAIYADQIIMLMSSKTDNFDWFSFLSTYASFFEENGLYIGVSGAFSDVYETRRYYDQAAEALAKGIASQNGRLVFAFSDAQ